MIRLEVMGAPAPKGSSRAFVIPGQNRAVVAPSGSPQNKRALRSWDQAVRLAANEAVRAGVTGGVTDGGPPFVDVALRLTILFRLARPSGHWAKRGGLKPSARAYPATKPDLDKLTRSTCDSLKGVIYDDDSRIVASSIEKIYGAPGTEGATITIELR